MCLSTAMRLWVAEGRRRAGGSERAVCAVGIGLLIFLFGIPRSLRLIPFVHLRLVLMTHLQDLSKIPDCLLNT